MLEDCRGVDDIEWHHLVLKIPIARPEGRFPPVPKLDARTIEGSPKVNFGEDTPDRS